MKTQRKILTAAGCTFAAIDHDKIYASHCFQMYGDTNISATARVDRCIANLNNSITSTLTQSTNTVTLTFSNVHYLGSTSDYVLISGTGITGVDGIYSVASVIDTLNITYTSPISQTLGTTSCLAIPIKFLNTGVASASVSTTPTVVSDVTAYSLLILNCTTYSSGTVLLDVLQQGQY